MTMAVASLKVRIFFDMRLLFFECRISIALISESVAQKSIRLCGESLGGDAALFVHCQQSLFIYRFDVSFLGIDNTRFDVGE